MAWLSNAVSSPATRFLVKSPDPYKRVDGTQIAANWAALTDGGLDAAITITETGAVGTSLYVWTATTTDGNILFGGDCIGWTDGTNGATANNGLRAQSTGQWTQSGFGTSCNSEWSLYCFQQA
jgi:hypothetical protein